MIEVDMIRQLLKENRITEAMVTKDMAQLIDIFAKNPNYKLVIHDPYLKESIIREVPQGNIKELLLNKEKLLDP